MNKIIYCFSNRIVRVKTYFFNSYYSFYAYFYYDRLSCIKEDLKIDYIRFNFGTYNNMFLWNDIQIKIDNNSKIDLNITKSILIKNNSDRERITSLYNQINKIKI